MPVSVQILEEVLFAGNRIEDIAFLRGNCYNETAVKKTSGLAQFGSVLKGFKRPEVQILSPDKKKAPFARMEFFPLDRTKTYDLPAP